MNSTNTSRRSLGLLWRELLRWLAICTVLSVVVGSVVAFFLWALDQVTALHWHYAWLVYLLPLAGLLSGWLYFQFGRDCEAGNSQIYARIVQYSQFNAAGSISGDDNQEVKVPWHMAPLVLVGTLLTHLCGGSAGREGTAIQIGGGLASGLASWLRLQQADIATVLQAGVAAGFGAVFGTPLAATLFAVEVLGRGVSRLSALPVCLFSSLLADQMTIWWGVEHTSYSISPHALNTIDPWVVLKIVALSIAFGTAAWLFSQSTRLIAQTSQKLLVVSWLRPAVGGVVLLAIVGILGSRQYLGLGVEANPLSPEDDCIVSSFSTGEIDTFSWFWKSLLTSVTIGFGFKGGEATPLFYIGATLGHSLGRFLGLSTDLAAGLGLVAVFAAATRTPLACSMMAVELFVSAQTSPMQTSVLAIYALLACQIAAGVSSRASSGRP